jgi:hypothetical protein
MVVPFLGAILQVAYWPLWAQVLFLVFRRNRLYNTVYNDVRSEAFLYSGSLYMTIYLATYCDMQIGNAVLVRIH